MFQEIDRAIESYGEPFSSIFGNYCIHKVESSDLSIAKIKIQLIHCVVKCADEVDQYFLNKTEITSEEIMEGKLPLLLQRIKPDSNLENELYWTSSEKSILQHNINIKRNQPILYSQNPKNNVFDEKNIQLISGCIDLVLKKSV